MAQKSALTGLVLAGGESRRMGRPKAGLEIGGRPLVGRVLESLRPFCSDLIIVARRPSGFLDWGVRVVRDLVVGQGPLGGLVTGLFYARTPWSLVAACDIPFLKPEVVELLVEAIQGQGAGPRAVVPRTPGGWQPLAAAYSRDCQAPARRLLEAGGRKVDDLRNWGVVWQDLPEKTIRTRDPELVSFFNINTPSELSEARGAFQKDSSTDNHTE